MSKLTEKLKQTVEELKNLDNFKKQYFTDERFWQPKRDEAGEVKAKIRFLPNKTLDFPFIIKKLSHVVKIPTSFGDKYIFSSCRRMINEDCFLCNRGSELWKQYIDTNSLNEELKTFAVSHFVRKRYIMNIYVIKDYTEPENNGKIFLFEFPEVIYKMIMEKISPTEDEIDLGIAPQMIVDPEEGNDFYLYIYKNKMGYNQYDKCKFLKSSKLEDWEKILGWDEKNEIFENLYDLQEIEKEIYEKIKNEDVTTLISKYEDYLSISTYNFINSENKEININKENNKKNKKIEEDIENEDNEKEVSELEAEDDELDDFFKDLEE